MISPGTYTLTNVSEPREWNSQKGGPMKSYTVKVQGDDGAYELSKKATSDAPKVGDSIDVESVSPPPEGTTYPAKLKLAFNKGGGKGGPSPADKRAMQRCHSQEMALRYAAIKQAQGKLPDEFKLSDLFKIADLFDADVTKVRGDGGAS